MPMIGRRPWKGAAAVGLAMMLGSVSATARDEPDKITAGEPRVAQEVGSISLPSATFDDELVIGGEEIDARKVSSRMTVPVRINGTGPYRFIVDSGADTSVVGDRIAAALGLEKEGEFFLHGMTESTLVDRVQLESLALGPTTIRDLMVPVLRERYIGAEGMIGLDALVEQRLMMDFDNRLISVDDARSPAPRFDGEIVVRARLQRGQLILTQARSNNVRIAAVVDTGSEVTVGNSALRDKLMRRSPDRFYKAKVTGVTGATADLDMAIVPQLRLGSIILQNVPVAFADLSPFEVFGLSDEPALLLGTDVMETFSKVSLDFHERKVRFQLAKCAPTRAYIGMGLKFSRVWADSSAPAACRK